jgi:hypothetical protein
METPTEAGLADLARRDGIDAATEFLYRYIRRAPAPSPLVGEGGGEGGAVQTSHAQLRHESLHDSPLTLTLSHKGRGDQTGPPRVIVVPGAFHEEYSHTGADGARIMRLAQFLGWPAERVPLPSLAPMAENAGRILDFLTKQNASEPIVLISLSKGSADLRTALERPDAAGALRNTRAWINLSGIVTGTPLIDWFRARPIRCTGVRLLLRLRRQRFAVLDELRRGPGTPLDRPFALPPHISAFHVLGFPRVQDLSDPWAQRGHARLAPLGPNDGGGNLLIDALRLPGIVYPVWAADHYLRSATIDSLLLNVIREAGAGET